MSTETHRDRTRPGTRLPRRLRPSAEALEARSLLSVGGGFTSAGIEGSYFANATLAGTPAFTRDDARIDFDWGTAAPVGGSTGPGYSAVKTGSFSARWAGQVVPNYSETYTFTATSNDGVRLRIKPSGSSTWTPLVDAWAEHPTRDDSGSFAMTAGRAYDVEMEYYQSGGSAVARLSWSGASTPREVIDPLGVSGINVKTYAGTLFADAIKSGREEWGNATDYFGKPKVAADADNWPLDDATKVVWEGRDPQATAGTYLLQFQGKADVSSWFSYGQFSAAGKLYGSKLPSGAGYDPATNTTTATVQVSNSDIFYLSLKNTQRTASSPLRSGVTNVSLMRPTSPGATTYDAPGTVFDPGIEAAFSNFTTERWLTANGDITQVDWSDRVLPGYQKADFGESEVWEYLVMLSNETGKDLYITIPINASADYVTKLARLIRYGSDGVNPYASQQPKPAYPGLNPNLKLYFEWSNETWNWSFSQASAGAAAAKQAVLAKTPEGQIINFDGKAPSGDFRRWTALKAVEASDAFRSVFGDSAMGDRIRPLLEYQYDDGQATATGSLNFIDNYFNNGDGAKHVATPHPVSYYLWGAGGATYYGAGNAKGYQSDVAFADPGFESIPVAPGATSTGPTGSSWTFSGDAGVYEEAAHAPAASSQALGTLGTSTGGAAYLGYKFTVGGSDIGVYQLGRWVAAGNSRSHTVAIVRASDRVRVASASIATSGATAGGYLYASLSRPVVLKAGTTYYLVSSEAGGKDAFYGADTKIAAAPGITVLGAASASSSSPWKFADGPAGAVGYGPVDFRFSASPTGKLGFVDDAPQGTQAAFLGGGGSISQGVYFPSAGVFALEVTAAVKDGAADPIRVFVDGVEATPDGNSYKPGTKAWTPGAADWGIDSRTYNALGTAPFTIIAPGIHTVTFVGTGKAGQYTYLDDLKVTSVDAIFAGGVAGLGQPQSGPSGYGARLDAQAQYALAFGLHVVAYEGGWSLGGDFGSTPLQNYAKYVDPRAAAANRAAIDAFARSGGALNVFGTYGQWPSNDTAHASSYPLLKSVIASNDAPAAAPTNGLATPAALTVDNVSWSDWHLGKTKLGISGFVTWNVRVTRAGLYTVTMKIGPGGGKGTARVSVDDATTIGVAPSGTLTKQVWLSAGLHAVKVKALSGAVVLLGGSVVLA